VSEIGRPEHALDRRQALGLIGGAAVAVFAVSCSGASSKKAAAPTSSTSAGAGAVTRCTLAPEVTQGPFWLTDHPQASNLVQDRKGTPLQLWLTVVDQECHAVPAAKVDVWHCDAAGTYAGVGGGAMGPPPGSGGAATRTSAETWLQGYQVAGGDGAVTFATIYPGWYTGRAVHIHVKVFVGGREHHTGQLFFPDQLSERVFAAAPYRGRQDTLNNQDSIYRDAGSAAVLSPQRQGDGYNATAQLIVAR